MSRPAILEALMGLTDGAGGASSGRAPSALMAGILLASLLLGLPSAPADGADGYFGGGRGTPTDPYVIEDVLDLQAMSGNLNACYVLGGDIDASATRRWNAGSGFYPIGNVPAYFAGRLDGAGHNITGLFINRPTLDYVGLFGALSTRGSVRDVALVDVEVTGSEYVGALVGQSEGAVDGSSASGTVTGSYAAIGGLAGVNNGRTSGSHASVTVNGSSVSWDVGGLVGYMEGGTVAGSNATGTVTGQNGIGGLVGASQQGTVEDSFATGDVSGTHGVGGLVGNNYCGTVARSHATGNVSLVGQSGGGLVGSNEGEISWSYSTGRVKGRYICGGFVGAGTGAISFSYATGPVSGIEDVGGLAGSFDGAVSKSYALGDVSGESNLGGLVGFLTGTTTDSYSWGNVTGTHAYNAGLAGNNWGTISRSYSTGRVTSPAYSGGMVAAGEGTALDCFWDTQSSGMTKSYGGEGRTTAQMRASATFTDAGWDLPGVWIILEGVTYPLLRWQDAAPPVAEAGADQAVEAGAAVALDGSGSRDDIGIASYAWTFVDGAPVTLQGVGPTHRFATTGAIVVTLNVTDAAGSWDTDSSTFTVVDTTAPVADAGPDQAVGEGTLVTFDGNGSSDNVKVVDWAWTFTDGAPVALQGVGPSYRFGAPGAFVVTLTVADAEGHQGTDTMTVTVNDTTRPVAEAGPDQSIDEGSPLVLDGSGSSDNVGIVNWTWSISTHGTPPHECHDETVTLWLRMPGTFTVNLTVRDAAGNEATDSMTVTVTDVIPPRADAGPDLTVDEGTPMGFDGRGSLDTGGISNYTWTFKHGGRDVALYGPEPSFTFDVPGLYPVELRVWDAAGHWDTDAMNVTVRDVRPPTADAGAGRMVDEDTPVAFDGSGSSDTAGIANYTWTFRYGTDDVALYGVSPSFTFEVPGTYPVRLRVSDAAGHWREDTVTLIVLDVTPPSADAGPDQRVPVGSSVSLDGSPSTDNVAATGHSWAFTYDGAARVLVGAAVHFTFDRAGVYQVVLNVTDAAGNADEDVVVVTVVDTGTVTGTVLDERGRPVEGATVVVTASDGKAYTASTAANGSFAVEVHHGPFTWAISKDGHRALTGTSSVDPMGTTVLDLSDTPLAREVGKGLSVVLLLTAAIVVGLVAAAAALVLRRRNLDGAPKR